MTDQALDYAELLERGAELYLQICEQWVDIRLSGPLSPDHYDDILVLLAVLDCHLAQRVQELAASDDEEEARLRVREAEAEDDRLADG